jgi:hypothetical protein
MTGATLPRPARKTAEIQAERWLEAGLPKGHGLAPTRVMAAQIAGLAGALLAVLRAQQERYARYVEMHPPTLAPISKAAIRDLPPEALETYHAWLENVVLGTEPGERARFALGRAELSAALTEALTEAIGTGAGGARRALGALGPGFSSLGRLEARRLLKDVAGYETASSPEARVIYQAVADRATGKANRAAVLRDGAGRLLGAVSFRTMGDALEVGHLGALEGLVPGTGGQLLRELAAVAAREEKGLVVKAAAEAEGFFQSVGFARDLEGTLRLSAARAARLVSEPGGLGAGWMRVGWLEGPDVAFVVGDPWAMGARALVKELREQWGEELGRGAAFAVTGVDEAIRAMEEVEAGLVAREAAEMMRLAVLRGAEGRVLAVAQFDTQPGSLRIGWLGTGLDAPAGTGRRMMRELSALAAKDGKGIVLQADPPAVGFYERLGMHRLGPGHEFATFAFTPEEALAFASGLTGPSRFAGQLTWELAVAGASDWLNQRKIPSVVDEVSKTTHQALVEALARGLAEGETTQELAWRVRHLDKVFGPARAERIARTEVLTANRHGGYQIGKEAGCQEHEWRARIESARTRDWHRTAHKQRVPYGHPYTIPNRKGELQLMLYPGDTSLGAGPDNVIQCRCSERRLKPGVTDDKTLGIDEHDLAGSPTAPGPVVAGVKVWVTSAG